MRKIVVIGWTNVRRVLRDRTATFFMFVFPFLIILTIGAVFGSSSTPVLGVTSGGSGPLGRDLVSRLDRTGGLDIQPFTDRGALSDAVARGEVEAGLVVPAGYTAMVEAGGTVDLPYIARPTGAGSDARVVVAAVVDAQAIELRAALFAVSEGVTSSFEDATNRARVLRSVIPAVTVAESSAGGQELRQFDYSAAQEVILFVFVISLAASSMLIETRRLGMSRRMLASPTSAAVVIAGEGLGRFAIALLEGLLIVVVSGLLFGVDWGDPVATGAVLVLFSLVGTGAAMLVGSVMENENQASSLGVFFSLVLAALGGCMVPLEIFPDGMRIAAHVTPHAWAVDAFAEILGKGAGVAQVAPDLGALALYAAVLLGLATVLFRRRLTA